MSSRVSLVPPVRALILLAVVFAAAPAFAQRGRGAATGPQNAQPVGAPRFEYVGPSSAGRIAAAAAVAGKPGVYFAGAASGGVWKIDATAALTWKPTFDNETSQAIGALAVAPIESRTSSGRAPAKRWAVRDMDMMGDGIYKSTDAGETWTNMGLVETGRIGTIVVHPTNENIVLVCALGRATGPQQERGVFRTEDGGKTWQQTCCSSTRTPAARACSMSQQDPNVVIAGTWEIELQTHVLAERRHGQRHLYLARRRQDVREGDAPRACRNRRTARPTSRSRRRTATGCTR